MLVVGREIAENALPWSLLCTRSCGLPQLACPFGDAPAQLQSKNAPRGAASGCEGSIPPGCIQHRVEFQSGDFSACSRGMIVSEKMPAQAALPAWNQEVWLINESMQEHSVMSEDSVCPLIAPPPSTCNCGSFANRGYGNETLQRHCGHDLQVERQQRPRG